MELFIKGKHITWGDSREGGVVSRPIALKISSYEYTIGGVIFALAMLRPP